MNLSTPNTISSVERNSMIKLNNLSDSHIDSRKRKMNGSWVESIKLTSSSDCQSLVTVLHFEMQCIIEIGISKVFL